MVTSFLLTKINFKSNMFFKINAMFPSVCCYLNLESEAFIMTSLCQAI